MTQLVVRRLEGLADTLADLKDRVRAAIAGELAQAIANAVRDVVVVVFAESQTGRTDRSRREIAPPGWEGNPDWTDPDDPWNEAARDPYRMARATPSTDAVPGMPPVFPVAAAATIGVKVGRCWLAYQGGLPCAVGIGLATGALALSGGPAARAVLAALAATADVLSTGDILPTLRGVSP